MERLSARVLLHLEGRERAIADPGGGPGGAHALEGPSADAAGGLEALDLQGVAAVVTGALRDQPDLSTPASRSRSRARKPIDCARRWQAAWYATLVGKRRERAVEAGLLADRPEQLARDRGSRPKSLSARGRSAASTSVGILPAQHHRAGGDERDHLGARVDERGRAGRGSAGRAGAGSRGRRSPRPAFRSTRAPARSGRRPRSSSAPPPCRARSRARCSGRCRWETRPPPRPGCRRRGPPSRPSRRRSRARSRARACHDGRRACARAARGAPAPG